MMDPYYSAQFPGYNNNNLLKDSCNFYYDENNYITYPHFPSIPLPDIAVAEINGGPLAPDLKGTVYFIDVENGTDVYADITGLPPYQPATENKSPIGPHGFHIHEVGSCEVGDPEDPFQKAGEHWNPYNQPHGNHPGDFPVLFSNNGIARMHFFTDRFKVNEIINKAVIIHQNPDDYRSQPAGNAGKRLGCGVIKWYHRSDSY